MAQGKGQPNSGINMMESGLIHTADSQGGSNPQGQFVDYFGEPGSPTSKSGVDPDGKGYPGRAPVLGKRWMRGGSGH